MFQKTRGVNVSSGLCLEHFSASVGLVHRANCLLYSSLAHQAGGLRASYQRHARLSVRIAVARGPERVPAGNKGSSCRAKVGSGSCVVQTAAKFPGD